MTIAPAILGALIDTSPHPDMAALRAVEGVALVPAAVAPASVVLICADGAQVGARYMSATDVLQSIRTGRLDAELLALRQAYPWTYLLIGGQLTPDRDGRVRHGGDATGWGWDAYQGALLTIQEMGVGVLTLRHADDLGEALSRLARRNRGPKRVKPLREALFLDPSQELLMALPGIGEQTADRLLGHCGTVAWALGALTSDVMDVPGIGPKTKASVRRALGLKDNEALLPTEEKKLPLHEQADLVQIGNTPVSSTNHLMDKAA